MYKSILVICQICYKTFKYDGSEPSISIVSIIKATLGRTSPHISITKQRRRHAKQALINAAGNTLHKAQIRPLQGHQGHIFLPHEALN